MLFNEFHERVILLGTSRAIFLRILAMLFPALIWMILFAHQWLKFGSYFIYIGWINQSIKALNFFLKKQLHIFNFPEICSRFFPQSSWEVFWRNLQGSWQLPACRSRKAALSVYPISVGVNVLHASSTRLTHLASYTHHFRHVKSHHPPIISYMSNHSVGFLILL